MAPKWPSHISIAACIARGETVDGLREGAWEFVSKDPPSYGRPFQYVMMRGTYHQGLAMGKWHYYGRNGKVSAELHCQDDKLEGSYKSFDTFGSLYESGQYTSNRRSGSWTVYDDDGTPRRSVEYQRGRAIEGSQRDYDQFGDEIEVRIEEVIRCASCGTRDKEDTLECQACGVGTCGDCCSWRDDEALCSRCS